MLKYLTRSAAIWCCCAAVVYAADDNTLMDFFTENETPAKVPAKAPAKVPAKAPAKVPATAQPASRRTYMIPCLTVRGNEGNLSTLPMHFSRTTEDSPLRIRIGDDTPNGSSQTIRINVWMAALTAAMLRNDTLHGVNISIDFSGNIDGPSAGGVTCLAILSAIDNLPLPNDFAMTGTIMPDGSIGVVGGVQAKIRAAAGAGKKRVLIPIAPRFEKDDKGNEVDLLQLGDELKIKVYQVTTVSEAYALIHRKPLPPKNSRDFQQRPALSRATEKVLTKTFRKYQKLVKQKVKAQPKNADVTIMKHYRLSPVQAEALFAEGKLLLATHRMIRTYRSWLAFERMQQFYNKQMPDRSWQKRKYLQEFYLRKHILAFIDAAVKEVKTFIETNRKQEEEHISKIHRNLRSPEGFFPFAPGQTEITAQLEPLDVAYIDGNILVFRNRRPTVEILNTANVKTLKNIFNNEINIVISNIILHHYLPDVTNFYAELGATMPQLRHNRYAAHVEELFHAAGVAAASVANEHIGDRIRSNPNRANAQKFQQNLQNNLIFNTYKRVNLYATYCHYLLDPEISKKAPASPAYHLQATIKLQVNNFAMAAASMVLFGPDLGANSNFLSHLLRNARTTAINNISECSDAGIPCLAAIYDFGMAEIAHLTGDTDADRLINYWRAALYAKALMMSFKPEK